MTQSAYTVEPIGWVESPLRDRAEAPRQGDEGAPEAWLVIKASLSHALDGVAPGDPLIVLTWLHEADRDVLSVHPRGEPSNPRRGVFATRSPDRPNPVGLHDVHVVAIEGNRIRVRDLEAIDGTPIIDLKPVLEPCGER